MQIFKNKLQVFSSLLFKTIIFCLKIGIFNEVFEKSDFFKFFSKREVSYLGIIVNHTNFKFDAFARQVSEKI